MPSERIGEAVIQRFLDPARVLRLAAADFGPIYLAYEEHVRRWELPLDATGTQLVREGLAALALHLATRPADETVGVTLNFRTPPLNVFLTGNAGTLTVTGRMFTEDVQTAGANRLFVQSYRPQTGPVQSAMDFESANALRVFEEYYARSEQAATRFLHLGAARVMMAQALPEGRPADIEALTPESAQALLDSGLELLATQPVHFRCGCNRDKILSALRLIFAGKEADLFRGESGVETFCPRCGARWWIERSVYDSEQPPTA
jgi:molecular chaperone Hsp33